VNFYNKGGEIAREVVCVGGDASSAFVALGAGTGNVLGLVMRRSLIILAVGNRLWRRNVARANALHGNFPLGRGPFGSRHISHDRGDLSRGGHRRLSRSWATRIDPLVALRGD
jgi:hypothetical protein